MQALTPLSTNESGRSRSPLPVGYVTPGFILLSHFYSVPQSKGMLDPTTRKPRDFFFNFWSKTIFLSRQPEREQSPHDHVHTGSGFSMKDRNGSLFQG